MFLGNSILKKKNIFTKLHFFFIIFLGERLTKVTILKKGKQLNALPLQKYLFLFPIYMYLYPLPNSTVKLKKIGTPKIIIKIVLELEKLGFAVICPQDVDEMTNSVDPDQTVPLGAV